MTEPTTLTARPLRVRAYAEVAASIVAPYYGLDAAIAVNPVLPSLSEGFASALTHAAPALGARGVIDEALFRSHLSTGRITAGDLAAAIRRGSEPAGGGSDDESEGVVVARFLAASVDTMSIPTIAPTPLDELVARWCRAALAPEASSWPVPVAQHGFYGAWRAVALHDLGLPRAARRRITALPAAADSALAAGLEHLGVHDDAVLATLRGELAQLPGWAAYIRWRSMTSADVDVVDYLAVRVSLRWGLGIPLAEPRQPGAAVDDVSRSGVARALIWQEAFEAAPHRRVLEALAPRPSGTTATEAAARAHLVFCIDPRSEGIRRHLEAQGAYATSGFAGFFGIAALIEPLAAAESSAACPVLLTPRYSIAERPAPTTWRAAKAFVTRQSVSKAWRSSVKAPDSVAGAPLGWAEVTGWVMGPVSAARSVLAGRSGGRGRPDDPTHRGATIFDLDTGLSLDTQIDTAEVILRTMGMVQDFAPLVVFVGHGTSTTNNAFRSALDCGACGGHRGAPNARIAATILNRAAVRAALAERGITIPADTIFMAAEHDTATDEVVFADLSSVPAERQRELNHLREDAARAGRGLAAERVRELPGAARTRQASVAVARRARDWAQVYPEWGLARNAALIIGPRSMSAGADLQRRTFLHSYDPQHDPDGVALETILTAPLVVAHWINAQYYFSSVDPEVLGAGSKTVHNLVGGAGVIVGPSGDLRLGLPWQSVATREGLHHEPVRLLVVVDAPRERITSIVDRADVVKDLVHGEWVILVRPGETSGEWERCTAEGWVPWHAEHNEQRQEKEAA